MISAIGNKKWNNENKQELQKHWQENMENFKILRDSCTPWFSLESLICTIRLLKVYLFDQLEPIFLTNFYAYNRTPLFHLVEASFLYLSVHPW